MIPHRLEYFSILLALYAFALSAYSQEIKEILRKREFWVSFGGYFMSCTIFDIMAIRVGWWTFNPSRICGVLFAGVPIEEFFLFFLVYLLAISAWESL